MDTPPPRRLDDDFNTPSAPSKDMLPMIDRSNTTRRINFAEEEETHKRQEEQRIQEEHKRQEERTKHCHTFDVRLYSFYADSVMPIEEFDYLLVADDYVLTKKTPTLFVCEILKYLKEEGKMEEYSNVLTKYANIEKIVGAAMSLCKTNERILDLVERIQKYISVVKKIVYFCGIELNTKIPVCIKSGLPEEENFHMSDRLSGDKDYNDYDDDEYLKKYLKYKNKYLELKRQGKK